MSSQLSRTEVIGFIGKDPEIRAMPSGESVANFSVAYSESWKDKSGQVQERTEWFRCTAFGATAEKFIGPYVHKGDLVRVVGKLWTRKWTDANGVERYSTELKLDRYEGIMLLRSKDGKRQGPAQGQAPSGGPAWQDFDDDIPF